MQDKEANNKNGIGRASGSVRRLTMGWRSDGLLSLVLILVSTLPLTAASPASGRHRLATAEIMARTELYFGTSTPTGEVSDTEFTAFVDAYVTPRFPDGLTLLTGYGQFLNASGTVIKERSKVLILFYPVQLKDANRLIQEIRSLYKEKFAQESVLRADSYSAISF
jgi:hypothetical protein